MLVIFFVFRASYFVLYTKSMPEGFDVVLEQLLAGAVHNPIISGLTILVLFALIQDFFLFKRLRRLVRGGDGKTLEGTIRNLQERTVALETRTVKTETALQNHESRLSTSVRGVAVKKFDLGSAGGQQSFATALIDEKGSGIVVSGIHARDSVRVYAKPVAKFSSERELSEEERGAIEEAKKKLTNN